MAAASAPSAAQALPAAQPAASGLPSFAELQATGARIGRIVVVAQDIFDTSDPLENKLLFRLANKLHIQTRPEIIERALLFKTGDLLSVRLLEETERLLRANRFLYDVRFRPLAVRNGLVDIEVLTRDTWSLEPGASAGRAGGANSSGVSLREHNLLGTGVSLGWGYSKNVDRSSSEFSIASDRVWGSRWTVGLSHANNSDGQRHALWLQQPFYALDTRYAGGLSAVRDKRIDGLYAAGQVVAEYRHNQDQADLQFGWSPGLVLGWAQRTTVGLSLRDDAYALEPGYTAPAQLPQSRRLRGPFVRFDWIEDRVDRETNRNQIGRPEFFARGVVASVHLGWATRSLGSSHNAVIYNASLSRGFEPAADVTLMAAVRLQGRVEQGQVQSQRLGGQLQLYVPHRPGRLFYAAAAVDSLTRPQPDEWLLLGGDSGLRGYPLRYQTGQRRALFTVEERAYTDLYVWRLFRVGGAAFVDVGRAWGGAGALGSAAAGNPSVQAGWLANVGMGLRVLSARSAFGNVVHLDLALPLNRAPDVKKLQLLVKTKASF